MRRVPVNLATRPFARVQRARRLTLVAAALVVVLSLAHAGVAWRLSGIDAAPTEPAIDLDELLRSWQAEVEELASVAESRRALTVATAVAIGNEMIAQRTFPWGELFALLERALPESARLEIVQPSFTDDGVRVSVTAAAASIDTLEDLIARLERERQLGAVWPVNLEKGSDGQYRLTVEVRGHEPAAGEDLP